MKATRARARSQVDPKAYAEALETLKRDESRLRRAFNAWAKSVDRVKRYEKRMDKQDRDRYEIAGRASPSDFAKSDSPLAGAVVHATARLRD